MVRSYLTPPQREWHACTVTGKGQQPGHPFCTHASPFFCPLCQVNGTTQACPCLQCWLMLAGHQTNTCTCFPNTLKATECVNIKRALLQRPCQSAETWRLKHPSGCCQGDVAMYCEALLVMTALVILLHVGSWCAATDFSEAAMQRSAKHAV